MDFYNLRILFVPQNNNFGLVLSMLLDFLQPIGLNVLKCFFIHEIEDEDYSMRIFVVGGRNRAETLLACSVPDLQLDRLLFNLELPE